MLWATGAGPGAELLRLPAAEYAEVLRLAKLRASRAENQHDRGLRPPADLTRKTGGFAAQRI